jgi:phosphoglycolate phosphatase
LSGAAERSPADAGERGGAPRFELVIFDFDGTLADSADWAIGQLNGAARRFGFRSVSDEEIAMLRGRTSQEITAYLGIPFWKLPRIAADMRKRMAADAARIALFSGVSELLAALAAAGVRMAIVSSNSEENVRTILGPPNVARIEQFSCGTAMFGKARRLRRVIRSVGVSPKRTLCIGDETRDIEAAREAGADSAAVAWGYADAGALAAFRPTFLFRSLADALPTIVPPCSVPPGG